MRKSSCWEQAIREVRNPSGGTVLDGLLATVDTLEHRASGPSYEWEQQLPLVVRNVVLDEGRRCATDALEQICG